MVNVFRKTTGIHFEFDFSLLVKILILAGSFKQARAVCGDMLNAEAGGTLRFDFRGSTFFD